MKFDVRNRYSGRVQFTAEIDCDVSASHSVKLGLAVRWAIRTDANLRDANLRGADLSGANLRGADLRGAYLRGAYLRDANLRGADLRGAYLRGANLVGANLVGAYLRGADLRDAYLRDAYLVGAYLRGADLSDADLRDAYLSGAYLRGANLIHCGARSDGYAFYAHMRNGEIWIKAGCRYFTIAEAKAHWKRTRGGTQLGDESLQLLKNAKRLVKIRGLLSKQSDEPKASETQAA